MLGYFWWPQLLQKCCCFKLRQTLAPFLKLFASIIFVLKESLDMQLKSLFLSSQLLRDSEFFTHLSRKSLAVFGLVRLLCIYSVFYHLPLFCFWGFGLWLCKSMYRFFFFKGCLQLSVLKYSRKKTFELHGDVAVKKNISLEKCSNTRLVHENTFPRSRNWLLASIATSCVICCCLCCFSAGRSPVWAKKLKILCLRCHSVSSFY